MFEQCTYKKKTSFDEANLSGVTFRDSDLRDISFVNAQIGYEAKFYADYRNIWSRERNQENYSDEVSFTNAGVEKADLEMEKAKVIKAKFSAWVRLWQSLLISRPYNITEAR